MSTARGILLISAGLAAFGFTVTTMTEGELDLARELARWRAPDAAARLAVSPELIVTAVPEDLATPPPPDEPVTQTVVLIRPSAVIPEAQPRKLIAPDRAATARALQGELQRVGCYAGSLDGNWTAPSQEAMRTFLRRINAQLPVEEPDQILLALLQARHGTVCPKSCPFGSSLADDNNCVAAKAMPPRAPGGVVPVPPVAIEPATAPAPRLAATGQSEVPAPNQTGPEQPASPAATPGTPGQKQKQAKAAPQPFGPDLFRRLLRFNP